MAYNFVPSGSVKYISTPDTSILDITGALTVSCWFQSNGSATGQVRGLIAKWTGSGNQRSYGISFSAANPSSNSKLNGQISSDGTFQAGNDVTGSTNLGTTWRHGAFVFVPSTSVTTYVDGIQDGQKTSSIGASIYSGTAALWIGVSFSVADTQQFYGDIAETAIYDTNLNSSEISALAKGFKPHRIRPQNLVFYSPLVRNLIEIQEKLTLTNNNSATVATHPRVI